MKDAPGDYCILGGSEENRLSQFERLTLTGGQDLDRILAKMSGQLASPSALTRLHPIAVAQVRDAHAFYEPSRWVGRENEFFAVPQGIIAPKITPVHGLADGEICDLEFPSSYVVQHPRIQEEWAPFVENMSVHARVWKHGTPAPATIIALHGWTMGDQRVNSLAFMPGLFYKLGFDIVLMELPFHGRRTPKVLSDSGDASFFPNGDVAATNEAVAQAISDVRQLRLVLRALGCREIGVMGMSLGAYIASLWATLDTLAFCIPMVPLVSMSEMAWEVLSRHSDFSRLKSEGLTPELLEESYRLHSPTARPLRIDPGRTIVIAGLGDSVVPARQPKYLWDHWKRPKMVWLSGGHSAHMRKDQVLGELVAFFKGLGYLAP